MLIKGLSPEYSPSFHSVWCNEVRWKPDSAGVWFSSSSQHHKSLPGDPASLYLCFLQVHLCPPKSGKFACEMQELTQQSGVGPGSLLPGDAGAAGLPSLPEERRPSAVAPSLGSFLGNTWEPLKHYCLGSFSREYDFIGLRCQLDSRIFQNSLGESTVVIKTHDLKWSSKNVVLPAPSASPVNRLGGTFLGSIPDMGQELRGGPSIYVVTRLCVS